MIRVVPIAHEDVHQVGRFLHDNLNTRIPADDWAQSLAHNWAASQPNCGMQLLDDERRVGVFCAIYSDQQIGDSTEHFCNPHSWCVLPKYRNHSISLVLPLLKQSGYHFTMFTPNPTVAEVFQGLKFRVLDDRLVYFPNLPSLRPVPKGQFVETSADRIAARLSGSLVRDFALHRSLRWLRFAVVGDGSDVCLAVYKRGRWKRMPCARLLHLSNPDLFARLGHLLRSRLLRDEGLLISRVEARFLSQLPPGAYLTRRTQPKLVRSSALADSAIYDLYSELVALDV